MGTEASPVTSSAIPESASALPETASVSAAAVPAAPRTGVRRVVLIATPKPATAVALTAALPVTRTWVDVEEKINTKKSIDLYSE